MERLYSAAAFGDSLSGVGTAWTYDRSARTSLMYGTIRSYPDSHWLQRHAYRSPHTGYSTDLQLSHSKDSGTWAASGQTLGMSAQLDTRPPGPDASLMNLISALDSRGPTSSHFSQFGRPLWQTGTLTSSVPSSSALSAYQHAGSLSGGPLPPSHPLQDTATFSPTHNSLLSPHDSLSQMKTSSLAFGRLLYSHSTIFRSSEEPELPSKSSGYQTLSPQINALSPQLHNQSTQSYNASTFPSTSALTPAHAQTQSPQQEEFSRQDNMIKPYGPPPSEFTAFQQHQYVNCGESSAYYQQRASQHRQAGVTNSPCGKQSPFSDFKASLQIEAQKYHPNTQSTYMSSSCPGSEETKGSSLSSGYSSSESTSFLSHTPHTPPLASTASSSISFSSHSSIVSLSAMSHQQPLGPALIPSTQQSAPTLQCLVSSLDSSSMSKSSIGLSGQSPPVQPYSPKQPPSTLMSYSCRGFRLPRAHDQGFNAAAEGPFSKKIGNCDSSFSSASLKTPNSPEYGSTRFSSVNRPVSGLAAHSGALVSAGNMDVSPSNEVSTYISKSNLSPSIKAAVYCSDVPSPASAHSPGGPQVSKHFLTVEHSKNPNEGKFCIQPLLQAQNSPSHPLQRDPTQYIGHSAREDKGLSCTENETPGEGCYSLIHLERPHNEHQQNKPGMTIPKSTAKNCPLNTAHSHHATSEPLHSVAPFGKSSGCTQYSHGLFMCNTPDAQQTHHSQISFSQMDSPPDPSAQTLSTHTKMDLLQTSPEQQQQESVSQQLILGSVVGEVQSEMKMKPHTQSSQQQLLLQSQKNDTDYSLESQLGDQTQYTQNSVPSHDFLDQSLQQYNSRDSQEALDSSGAGMSAGGRAQDSGDRHQVEIRPQTLLEHNDFTSKPDLHHPNQTYAIQLNQQQQQQQAHAASCLSHSQLSQPNGRGAASTRNEKPQQHFASLSSACFPEPFLQDEDHSFFPIMEEMFCSSHYKTGCAGDSGTYLADQGGLSQSHKQVQGNMVSKKIVASEGGFDLVGDHSDGSCRQYYHGLQQIDSSSDFMSLKASTLSSTVNADQLGLIQSQTPSIALTSNITDLTPPIFCSSRPKKLKTSSFNLLKHRSDSQIQSKKNYAQEYEFENEDKADVPADIRLNSRRFPDVLPDLVSSCRRVGGVLGGTSQMVDMDFCFPSSCNSLTSPQPNTLDGPRKRGRKPTKPKREGPPRPRGRPRIRPLPEPSFCRGLTGSGAGVSRRGRGRGRGRGRSEDRLVHQGINKVQSMSYHCQQEYPQQQFSQHQHSYELGPSHPSPPLQRPQQHNISAHTSQHQKLIQHRHLIQQEQGYQQLRQETERPIKLEFPLSTIHLSESGLRTDSISSSEPVLSDGSVGSAPFLGLSPGPNTCIDISGNEPNQIQGNILQPKAGEVTWIEESKDLLNSDGWAAMHKLPCPDDIMGSFLDFLKTDNNRSKSEPKQDSLEQDVIKPQSPATPTPQQQACTEAGKAQQSSSSTNRPLDEELNGNLETLPSFSSDEEDSVSKNRDLQQSITCAISTLYDNTHSLAAAMMSAFIQDPPTLTPSTPEPPLPAMSPLIPAEPKEQEQDGNLACISQENEEPPMAFQKSENEKKEFKGEKIVKEAKTAVEEDTDSNGTLQKDLHKHEGLKDDHIPEMVEEPRGGGATAGGGANGSGAASPSGSAPPIVDLFPDGVPKLWPTAGPPAVASTSTLLLSPLPVVAPSGKSELQSEQQQCCQTVPFAEPAPQPCPRPVLSTPPVLPSSDPGLDDAQLSPLSPSSSSTSPPTPPTPDEALAPQRLTSLHLAKKQDGAAIAGESEEGSESEGEGIFRERDEFVVRTEDIGSLKMALQTGREPPPIWRVQKALLQKFCPEIKDGQRQFCATSNYLGYFGDAKIQYQRLYVKFLENINKKDYVRVCSRRPWHRAALTVRRQSLHNHLGTVHLPALPRGERQEQDQDRPKDKAQIQKRLQEPEVRVKEKEDKTESNKRRSQVISRERQESESRERRDEERLERPTEDGENHREKDKVPDPMGRTNPDPVEPHTKKRRTWPEARESSSSESDSSPASDEEAHTLWSAQRGLTSRALRDMFRSYVEMLVSTALDPDMIQALEDTEDELYLPPMRKIDGLLSVQKKRLLRRVNMSTQHQEAIHIFPKMTADPLESDTVKVSLGGQSYNRKTLNRVKKRIPKQQDLKLSVETCRIYSLYHSLHHYKYHTFLRCKKETASVEQASDDPGQEEVVQQCMANHSWLEKLFSSFMELLCLSTKA